jgi:hypothetical protein
MNVLVIKARSNGHIVAVVEKFEHMSAGGVALAWAKGSGYERFPKDCEYVETRLTTFGEVMRNITPYCELEKLEADAK